MAGERKTYLTTLAVAVHDGCWDAYFRARGREPERPSGFAPKTYRCRHCGEVAHPAPPPEGGPMAERKTVNGPGAMYLHLTEAEADALAASCIAAFPAIGERLAPARPALLTRAEASEACAQIADRVRVDCEMMAERGTSCAEHMAGASRSIAGTIRAWGAETGEGKP